MENHISATFALIAEKQILDGFYKEAIETCETGLKQYPNYPSAMCLLAKAYYFAEDLISAESIIKIAMERFPTNIAITQTEKAIMNRSLSLEINDNSNVSENTSKVETDVESKNAELETPTSAEEQMDSTSESTTSESTSNVEMDIENMNDTDANNGQDVSEVPEKDDLMESLNQIQEITNELKNFKDDLDEDSEEADYSMNDEEEDLVEHNSEIERIDEDTFFPKHTQLYSIAEMFDSENANKENNNENNAEEPPLVETEEVATAEFTDEDVAIQEEDMTEEVIDEESPLVETEEVATAEFTDEDVAIQEEEITNEIIDEEPPLVETEEVATAEFTDEDVAIQEEEITDEVIDEEPPLVEAEEVATAEFTDEDVAVQEEEITDEVVEDNQQEFVEVNEQEENTEEMELPIEEEVTDEEPPLVETEEVATAEFTDEDVAVQEEEITDEVVEDNQQEFVEVNEQEENAEEMELPIEEEVADEKVIEDEKIAETDNIAEIDNEVQDGKDENFVEIELLPDDSSEVNKISNLYKIDLELPREEVNFNLDTLPVSHLKLSNKIENLNFFAHSSLELLDLKSINFDDVEIDEKSQDLLKIAKGLENAKIIPIIEDEVEDEECDTPLVASETMAKILVKQNAYAKAIKVYQMLIIEKPEKSDYYNEQILMIQNEKATQPIG